MKILLRIVTGGLSFAWLTVAAYGASLRFDGADDYVSVPTARIPTSGDFTVECWARADLPPAFGLREILSQGTSGNAFYIGTDPSNNIRAGDGWAATGVPFPFGGWHHFAVVKTSGNAFLYIDGLLRATRGAAIPNPIVTDFRIGRQYGVATEYWRGDVDEIRVWNTARTGAEIQQNMNLRLPGNTAGLVSCIHLDEGFGNSTTDATQNLALGTLINGPTWNPI